VIEASKGILPVGTLLLPGEYQVVNSKQPISGVVLEAKDGGFGMNYRVYLTNGITRWIRYDVIRDLFVPVQSDPVT